MGGGRGVGHHCPGFSPGAPPILRLDVEVQVSLVTRALRLRVVQAAFASQERHDPVIVCLVPRDGFGSIHGARRDGSEGLAWVPSESPNRLMVAKEASSFPSRAA